MSLETSFGGILGGDGKLGLQESSDSKVPHCFRSDNEIIRYSAQELAQMVLHGFSSLFVDKDSSRRLFLTVLWEILKN